MKMNQNQMSEEDVKKTRQATESIVEQCLKHVSTCRTMNLIHKKSGTLHNSNQFSLLRQGINNCKIHLINILLIGTILMTGTNNVLYSSKKPETSR
jgi:hypothetical protein